MRADLPELRICDHPRAALYSCVGLYAQVQREIPAFAKVSRRELRYVSRWQAEQAQRTLAAVGIACVIEERCERLASPFVDLLRPPRHPWPQGRVFWVVVAELPGEASASA